MQFTLNIWRQPDQEAAGDFVTYEVDNISEDDSFLEMLDQLNEQLINNGEDAIAFDYDCREGICGACGVVINGYPHGKQKATTVCQLYMRQYKDERELWIEPWRASAFPVLKDLIVDRSALDTIIQSGGYTSSYTGNAPEANQILVAKEDADEAFNAATCIGCGACVAVCPNASATLFVAAKISHLDHLPQGKIASSQRKNKMLEVMHNENFGTCSNHRHCSSVCPKEISLYHIVRMNAI